MYVVTDRYWTSVWSHISHKSFNISPRTLEGIIQRESVIGPFSQCAITLRPYCTKGVHSATFTIQPCCCVESIELTYDSIITVQYSALSKSIPSWFGLKIDNVFVTEDLLARNMINSLKCFSCCGRQISLTPSRLKVISATVEYSITYQTNIF